MPLSPSAHTDSFAREHLPPESLQPTFLLDGAQTNYPEKLNAAVELLDRTVEKFGRDRVALRVASSQAESLAPNDQEVWSYGELLDRVNQVAHVLVGDYGILPGNRVVIRIPNNPWAVITWLATLKIGAIALTSMVAWHEHELERVIHKVQASLLIADHRFEVDLASIPEAQLKRLRLGGDNDQLITVSATKPTVYDAVLTAADDVALLAPTSGTTGTPKVTMHFHRDLLAIADTFASSVLQLTPDDVSAGSPPLAFTFGLGGLVIFPFRSGGASVLIERSNPGLLADAIDNDGVTVLYTAPSGYRTFIKENRTASLQRLRLGISAGENLPLDTFEDVQAEAGLRLINGIGSTEMLHVFISASGDDIRAGSTGKVVPGYKAAILDEDGSELPPGQSGNLAVIGPTGCRYLDDERQSNYVQNGWNLTGDRYEMDEDGYFYFQSRTDDMIITAGYNVGGPEVEAAIDTHPSVQESIVVGRPDSDKGMIVNAFVVLAPGESESEETKASIINHVREHLTAYKAPRRIDFVDALPRNPSGKLQRFVLRERARHEYEGSLTQSR